MGRTKRITTIEETGAAGETPAEELDDQDQQTKDEIGTIESARQRIGGSCAKAMIYRYDIGGNPAYVGPCAPDVISDDFLQSVHGAGRYLVKFIGTNGRYLGNVTAYIAAAPAGETKQPAAASPAPVTREDLLGLQVETLKAEMLGQREMMLKLIEKMGSSDGQRSSSVAEIVQAIGSLGKLIPDPPNVLGQIRDLVGILKPLGFGGQPPAGSNWTDVVRDVLASVPQILEQVKMAKTMQPAAQPALNPTQPPAQVAEDPRLALLRRGIAYLKQKALADKDPAMWAEMIADNLEDAQWQPFLELLQRPYEEIAQLDPDLLNAPYRAWFEELLKGIQHEIHERSSPDGKSGDVPDAVPNA